MDRSPPADANFLQNCNALFGKSMEVSMLPLIEKNGGCLGGTVVSTAHRTLIMDKFSIKTNDCAFFTLGLITIFFKPTNS